MSRSLSALLLAAATPAFAAFVPVTTTIDFQGLAGGSGSTFVTQGAQLKSPYSVASVGNSGNSRFITSAALANFGAGMVAANNSTDSLITAGGNTIAIYNAGGPEKIILNSLDLNTSSAGPVTIHVYGLDSLNSYIPRFDRTITLSSPGGNFQATNYQTYSFSNYWTSSAAVVVFSVSAGGNGVFVGLDNVVLTSAIPEPSTYGVALGGLALAAVALRRRRTR